MLLSYLSSHEVVYLYYLSLGVQKERREERRKEGGEKASCEQEKEVAGF